MSFTWYWYAFITEKIPIFTMKQLHMMLVPLVKQNFFVWYFVSSFGYIKQLDSYHEEFKTVKGTAWLFTFYLRRNFVIHVRVWFLFIIFLFFYFFLLFYLCCLCFVFKLFCSSNHCGLSPHTKCKLTWRWMGWSWICQGLDLCCW